MDNALNSVLIKQETNKIEWFYSAIKPYINYVPVNEDISNIFEQIEWMKKNDEKIKIISKKAQNFIVNDLMPEHIDKHSVLILNEYSKLHKGSKILPSLYSAVEIENIIFNYNAEEAIKKEKRYKIKKIKNFLKNLFN